MATVLRYWKKQMQYFIDNETDNLSIVKYFEQNGFESLIKCNEASSRAVFAINEHYVIKIALNEAGVMQNTNEMNIWESLSFSDEFNLRSILTKIDTENSDTYAFRFVVHQRVKKYNRSTCRQINKLMYTDEQGDKLRDKIRAIDSMYCTCNQFDLSGNNLGLRKGKLVLLDYGVDDKIGNYYTEYRKIKRSRGYYKGKLTKCKI